MTLTQLGLRLLDRGALPDFAIRAGIRHLLKRRLRECGGAADVRQARAMDWVRTLQKSALAIDTDAANAQHYELPAEFFVHVLGPHLKYSSGLWSEHDATLERAEAAMLRLYAERAQVDDGMRILDLGCGWGSLSLYLAEHFPKAHILGVSNAARQRAFIAQRARDRGLRNVEIVTQDVNTFAPTQRFDRVLSIEMLEHVRNYELMFERIAAWLNDQGKLFVHVFCHREAAYPFSDGGDDDWMAKHFFTGGQMPSDRLLLYFQRDLCIENHWRVPGTHYQKTAEAWLANFDRHRKSLDPLLRATYGAQAARMANLWRVFFMACAELFGFRRGEEWFVAHYLFAHR